MSTSATIKQTNPAPANRKNDKIIKKITNSPTEETDNNTEKLIAIIPASTSTPIEDNNTHKTPTTKMHANNTTEERQNTDDIPGTIHTEKGMPENVSALSSISLPNTIDIEALNKNFLTEIKVPGRRKCGGRIHLDGTKYTMYQYKHC